MSKEAWMENWDKICHSLSQPLFDLAQLNINTLKNWSKNTGHFEELMQAKKPEELLMTQMKLMSIGQLEAMSYAKRASDIIVQATEQLNELSNDFVQEVAKASKA